MQERSMFPTLLISRDSKKIKAYIKDVIKKNNIPSFAVFEFSKDKTSIKIDQLRQISQSIPRGDAKKLIVIHDFETAKRETQNAFLKTLEEKTDEAIFIIVASDELSVLPTVMSRCKKIILKGEQKLSKNSFPENDSLADLLMRYQNMEKKKETAINLCDDILSTFRPRLRENASLVPFLKEVLNVRQLIDKNNLNPQIAIDHVLICYKSCTPEVQ